MAIGSTFTYDEIIRPLHHGDPVKDYKEITASHEYQDGGRSFNEYGATPPITWRLVYAGLTASQAADFDEHFDTYWYSRTFTFVDKWAASHSNVRYLEYIKSHDAHKSWIKTREMVLVKYP